MVPRDLRWFGACSDYQWCAILGWKDWNTSWYWLTINGLLDLSCNSGCSAPREETRKEIKERKGEESWRQGWRAAVPHLKRRHSHSRKYITAQSFEDSTVQTAQADLHPLASNYLKAQGFNWKPTANQNISQSPVFLFINVYFLRLNQLLISHTLLPFQLQSRLLSHEKKINSTYVIINFTAWLFPAMQFFFFIFQVPYKLMKIKSPSAHAQAPCTLSRTSLFCNLISHF